MKKDGDIAAALFRDGDGRLHARRAAQERAMAKAATKEPARQCHEEMAVYHEAMSGED